MGFHHLGEGVHVPLGVGEGFQRAHAGEGLKAELGAEPGIALFEIGEGFPPVPDGPVVNIAPVEVVGVVKISAGGGGRGPVEGIRRFPFAHALEDFLKLPQIIRPQLLGVIHHIAPGFPGGFHLVVAADQPQRSVMAQPAQIVLRLPGDAFLKGGGHAVHIAGEHQVQPDDQALFVAQVHEMIVGVDAAAPDADAVEIRPHAVLKQPGRAFLRHPGEQIVLRDIIRAHGEELHPVAAEGKFIAPFVLLGGYGQGAQTDTQRPFVLKGSVKGFRLQGVEGMLAQAVGPPQLRIGHLQVQRRIGRALRLSGLIPVGVKEGDAAPGRSGLQRDLQADVPILMHLMNAHVLQPGGIALQIDIPPDARVGQTGAGFTQLRI